MCIIYAEYSYIVTSSPSSVFMYFICFYYASAMAFSNNTPPHPQSTYTLRLFSHEYVTQKRKIFFIDIIIIYSISIYMYSKYS